MASLNRVMRAVRQGTVLAVISGLLPSGSEAQANTVDSLWVGVLGSDGVVVPVARYWGREWTAPWPEPVYGEAPSGTPPGGPSIWYVYADGSEVSAVSVTEVVVANAHCGWTWALATDWEEGRPTPDRSLRPVVGMVLSQRVDLIDEREIPGIEQYRERLGLVSVRERGEKSRRSTSLGYFALGSQLMGVFFEQGYEGELYELHRVSTDAGGRVVQVSGGGC